MTTGTRVKVQTDPCTQRDYPPEVTGVVLGNSSQPGFLWVKLDSPITMHFRPTITSPAIRPRDFDVLTICAHISTVERADDF